MTTNNPYLTDNLNVLVGETDSQPVAVAGAAEDSDMAYCEGLMDGTRAYRVVFTAADAPVSSAERILIEDVTTVLEQALDVEGLNNVSDKDLLTLVGRLGDQDVVFFIAKGLVFSTLRTRFPRERDFYECIKANMPAGRSMERRTIQTYMRVCRIFWIELRDTGKRAHFARYYCNVPLDRLELLGRENNRSKWFFGSDAIILQDCVGAGRRVEDFANLDELKQALCPVGTEPAGQDMDDVAETPGEPEPDDGERPNLNPVTPIIRSNTREGVDVRVEGINIIHAADGTVEALPGARLA